jgi:hypothetical protein
MFQKNKMKLIFKHRKNFDFKFEFEGDVSGSNDEIENREERGCGIQPSSFHKSLSTSSSSTSFNSELFFVDVVDDCGVVKWCRTFVLLTVGEEFDTGCVEERYMRSPF